MRGLQIDFEAFAQLVDENTAAVLINSPNNPSGTAYSEETLQQLADFLTATSAKYGHHIFLISDEPYREISFGAGSRPTPPNSTMIRSPATPSPRV